MKVKCINAIGAMFLTEGEIYEVVEPRSNFYGVLDDDGYRIDYYKTRFEQVETEDEKSEKSNVR